MMWHMGKPVSTIQPVVLARDFDDTRYTLPMLVLASFASAIESHTGVRYKRLLDACKRVNANTVHTVQHSPKLLKQVKALNACGVHANRVLVVTINTVVLALRELRLNELAASIKDLSKQAQPATHLPADVNDGMANKHYFQVPDPMPTSLPELVDLDLGRKKYGLLSRYCNNRNSDWQQLSNAVPLKMEIPQFKKWCTDLMVLDKPRASVQEDTFDSILSNVSMYLGFVHAYFNVPLCYMSLRLFTNLHYLLHFFGFKWNANSKAQGPQTFLNVIYRSRQALEFIGARDPAVKPGTLQVGLGLCVCIRPCRMRARAPR